MNLFRDKVVQTIEAAPDGTGRWSAFHNLADFKNPDLRVKAILYPDSSAKFVSYIPSLLSKIKEEIWIRFHH